MFILYVLYGNLLGDEHVTLKVVSSLAIACESQNIHLVCAYLCVYRTLELKVFQNNYAHLRDTIQVPEDVANRLYTREKIDSHLRDKVQLQTLTTSEKCEQLLKAVEHEISADPTVFYEFTEVLSEEPTTEKMAYQLVCEARSWVASYCIVCVLHPMC